MAKSPDGGPAGPIDNAAASANGEPAGSERRGIIFDPAHFDPGRPLGQTHP